MKRRGLLFFCVVAALAFGGVSFLASEKDREERVQLQFLTDNLRNSRAEANSCMRDLQWQEEAFRHFDALVDSLHARALAFENPDQGGVPEAVYLEYLSVFSEYNDSVAVWQNRADALRASEERCRELARLSNILGDSLRKLYDFPGDTLP